MLTSLVASKYQMATKAGWGNLFFMSGITDRRVVCAEYLRIRYFPGERNPPSTSLLHQQLWVFFNN